MSKTEIIYNAVLQMVVTFANIGDNPKLLEFCDFGKAYGFLFDSPDIFSNQYWCVDKGTYKPFTFTENLNIEMFMKREILPLPL